VTFLYCGNIWNLHSAVSLGNEFWWNSCPEADSASYPVDTGDSFLRGKAAGAWSWPLFSYLVLRIRMHKALPPLPYMPSWHGAWAQGLHSLK
jgi:hypothetical protein